MPGWKGFVALAVVTSAIAAVEALQHRRFGAPYGKRRTDIRIVDIRTGRPASAARVFVRGLVLAVPLAVAAVFWFESILYAWAGAGLAVVMLVGVCRDVRQRGIHDKIAGTEVFSTDVCA